MDRRTRDRRKGVAGAIILLALAIAAIPTSASEEQALPGHRLLARDLLRVLIEIDTTHATGSTTRAAHALAERLLEAGFPEADVQIIEEVPQRANLVARLRGTGQGRKPLLLLAHLDVVPADPADWKVEPFVFLERDGFFYGRGSSDDKDEAAIHVANLVRLKQEGFVPDRDIIVALTADEEGGDHNGVRFLLASHRDAVDAAFALNEGGGGALRDGRRISNRVQASEKIYQSFRLEVTNPGGHSSRPVRENAIYRLAAALLRVGAHAFPVELNPVTRIFFERTAPLEDPEIGAAMRGILSRPPDPASVEVLAPIPGYNAGMRTTCVATILEAGHAENALPQRAAAIINCRILPGVSPDEVQEDLERVIDDPEVSIQAMRRPTTSPPSPLTPEVMGAIERITEEMWPGVPVIPTMSTGATDARFLRNAGIPVYGVSGIFGDVDDVRAHGRDERISVQAFFEGQEFLYRLVKALTTSGTD